MTDPLLVAERYEVLRPLGRGSFGHTLLARDVKLGRQVALKVLQPRAAADLKAFELFEREAAVLRELRHPGVPAIHATLRAPWEGADAAFLVMEYIEGNSLAEVIAAGRHLEESEVLHWFVELLGLLEYLHTRMPPVLHRDIKPANVIVRPEGGVALVDFGAVRNVFRAPDEEGSTIVGTHGYMPYEQYMGQASPASDLYALGATFLHLMTGRPPREFMSSAGRLTVPGHLPGSGELRVVLGRLLSPAPADRFQTAREARDAVLRPPGPAPSPAGVALAPLDSSSALVLAEQLGPTPRPLQGKAAEVWRGASYSAWALMNTGSRGSEEDIGVLDVMLFAFFSLITVGILPAVFFSIARGRRKRMKQFVIHGTPAVARVLDKQNEKTAFDEKLTRVRYEFEGDGKRQRGSDQVLPSLAERWEPGESIMILYRADRGYDSVIVSTS